MTTSSKTFGYFLVFQFLNFRNEITFDIVRCALPECCLHSQGGDDPSAIHHQPHEAKRDIDHEEDNDAGEFEIARLITECLGRYDNMGEGSGDERLPCDMGNAEDAWVPSDDDLEAEDMY
jgi:hypothetical protein